MNYMIRPIMQKKEKTDNTILFAAQELQKYFLEVSDAECAVIPSERMMEKSICIGVKLSSEIPNVKDDELDDAIYIEVENNCGVITGNNPRATLIAVYRFLKEQGFCFLRPGKGGEIYPENLKNDRILVCEKASYRHRGICIEGSVFQKNLMDIIDWIPKVSMSGYFIQFQIPQEFLNRWYLKETPYREKVEFSKEDATAITRLAESEIEKRSLLYHGVGHGWTAEVFGMDSTTWSVYDEIEDNELLAMINGRRNLWQGKPLNTHLCYSKKEAREKITDNIVKYCKEHSNVSYLHFWLADDLNNNCECEECRKLRTSDYYVMMLNELDEKLSKEGLDTKIVFLIYVDLLWKPISEKIKNKDRFVMMFAPITRSYSESYKPEAVGEMKPYELNKLQFPKDVSGNLAYLYDWQKDFDGDSFDFDYHFIFNLYHDFTQYRNAQILSEDIKKLGDMGLNGLISCQTHRVFSPTSLGMNVMAETLWNKDISFDDVSDRILKFEFGEKYEEVQKYISVLSETSWSGILKREKDVKSEECKKELKQAIEIIEKFKLTIVNQIENADNQRLKKAWEKLDFYGELYRLLLEFYLEYAEGKGDGDFSNIKDFVLRNEMRYKDEFDAMFFFQLLGDGFEARVKKE